MKTKNMTTMTAEANKQEMWITREFDAPVEKVFNAYTDAALYVQWVGPKRMHMTMEQFEPRAGGMYRFIHTDEKGTSFGFHGVYHEVKAPELIIDTFEFEGLPEPGHVALETTRFESLPGNRTKVVTQTLFPSVADRDGMLQGGTMEEDMQESFDRLDELLEK